MGSPTLRRALRPVVRAARLGRERWDRATARAIARRVTDDDTADVRRVHRTRSGMRILRVDGFRSGEMVLKMTDVPAAAALLDRERRALDGLRNQPDAIALRPLVPEVLRTGMAGSWAYLGMRTLPGESSTPFAEHGRSRALLLASAADVAAQIHHLAASEGPVTEGLRHSWIRGPAGVVGSLLDPSDRRRLEQATARVEASLPDAVRVGMIHGDFWTENILVDPATLNVTGVVDWDSSETSALALHDLLHLVLYGRKKRRGTEIGDEICAAMQPSPDWDDAEKVVMRRAVRAVEVMDTEEATHTALVLYWLRLVSVNLQRQPMLGRSPRWVNDNIRRVLPCL